MRPLFLELGEPVLLGQNHGCGQQRAQTDNPLQPEKRRRVEFDPAKLAQYGVGEHPERDKEQNEAKKDRLPDRTTDAFEDPLRAADLLLFTRVELQNGLDILADLVAIGFEWRVPGIRRRRWRNGRIGSHQGMLHDPAGPRAGKIRAPLTHKFRWHSRPAREGGRRKSRIEEPGFWTPVRIARDEFA